MERGWAGRRGRRDGAAAGQALRTLQPQAARPEARSRGGSGGGRGGGGETGHWVGGAEARMPVSPPPQRPGSWHSPRVPGDWLGHWLALAWQLATNSGCEGEGGGRMAWLGRRPEGGGGRGKRSPLVITAGSRPVHRTVAVPLVHRCFTACSRKRCLTKQTHNNPDTDPHECSESSKSWPLFLALVELGWARRLSARQPGRVEPPLRKRLGHGHADILHVLRGRHADPDVQVAVGQGHVVCSRPEGLPRGLGALALGQGGDDEGG